MRDHYIQEGGNGLDSYQKTAMDASAAAIRHARGLRIKKYLIDNIIGILAFIVAVLALFK